MIGPLLSLLLAMTAPARPQNVLLITVDDMNWDSVGVYGAEIPNLTPHIDRLAREGLRFEHAHVTIAICDPDALESLAEDPAYRAEMERHRELLVEQMRATEDPELEGYETFLATLR